VTSLRAVTEEESLLNISNCSPKSELLLNENLQEYNKLYQKGMIKLLQRFLKPL